MTRRFREHDERSVAILDGIWDFVFLGDVEPDGLDLQAIDYPDRMAVPGCFDATPAYAGQRGLAAYRTQIEILDESPHRLVFNSVQNWCRVFVNGQLLGEHANGFTRFTFDVASQPVGPADLVVLVDNRLNTTKAPLHLDYFDWYHFGGIDRPVTLERLGLLWINDLQVETVAIDPPTLALRVAYSAVEQVNEVVLRIIVNGEVQHEETVNPDETAGVLERTLTLPGAALWSPDAPHLHELYVQLGEDDLRERVGIRQVAVQGRQILINDKPVRLLGFCRHEAHPQFGSALPEAIMISDIQLLRDMGCNFVRGSHYPQDVRFLDLCDEVGLCVWNEVIGWQHKAEHLTDPNFMAAQQTNLDEMVAMSRNRPSIIMWGLLNESDSNDPTCRPAYETLLGRLRELDSTRPVTFATHRLPNDLCLDLADIISINTYPGWYIGEIEGIPAKLNEFYAHLDAMGQGEKPIIISEIGAGAVPGWRDVNETRWSEPYQARLLAAVIDALFGNEQRACGLSIWQFCDCRSSEAVPRILGRPRGFNNKGVVDEYRRPKMAYEVVKAWFRALA